MSYESRVQSVQRSIAAGKFREAFDAFQPIYSRAKESDCLLLAELHLRLGSPSEALSVLGQISGGSKRQQSARALELLGWATRHGGDLEKAVRFFEKSASLAESSKDLEQVCRSQLWLLSASVEVGGPSSIGSLAATVRRNVLRLGRADAIGALHLRFAEVEARRSALDLAERHLAASLVCATGQENVWLQGQSHLMMSVVDSLRSRTESAGDNAELALRFARDAGNTIIEFAALSNLGLSHLLRGNLTEAAQCFRRAEPLADGRVYDKICSLDNLAQLELRRGRHTECGDLLDELNRITGSTLAQQPWSRLASNVTKVRLLAAIGAVERACEIARESRDVARERGDALLEAQFIAFLSSLSDVREGVSDGPDLLLEATDILQYRSFQAVALLEWAVADAYVLEGADATAHAHAERAARIFEATGCAGTRDDFFVPARVGVSSDNARTEVLDAFDEVEALSHLISYAAEPELLGREAVAFVGRMGIGEASLIVHRNKHEDVVIETPQSDVRRWRPAKGSSWFRLRIGSRGVSEYELVVVSKPGLLSRQLVKALERIIQAAVDAKSFRDEAQRRTSLWPIDQDLMLGGHIYIAPRMRELVRAAQRIAPTDLPVLITGETGTGKEILAREIHDSSKRARKPFAVFVCSAVPRDTLDSHLFGHRRGAFTGAVDNFPGVIRANEGGTLFLDEIGEIDPELQTKLLRFLESGEIHPLGETRPLAVDVRVIAATNQPLDQLLAEGRFREDFYYRLNVMRFHLPPLRERREEILPLVDHFLTRECAELGKPVPTLSDEAVEHLLLHRWPGNIRQVYNEMRRIAATIEPNDPITPDVLAPEIVAERRAAIGSSPTASPNHMVVRLDQPLNAGVEQLERAMIEHALAASDGHLETAARRLGVSRKGLFLKRQRLDIP